MVGRWALVQATLVLLVCDGMSRHYLLAFTCLGVLRSIYARNSGGGGVDEGTLVIESTERQAEAVAGAAAPPREDGDDAAEQVIVSLSAAQRSEGRINRFDMAWIALQFAIVLNQTALSKTESLLLLLELCCIAAASCWHDARCTARGRTGSGQKQASLAKRPRIGAISMADMSQMECARCKNGMKGQSRAILGRMEDDVVHRLPGRLPDRRQQQQQEQEQRHQHQFDARTGRHGEDSAGGVPTSSLVSALALISSTLKRGEVDGVQDDGGQRSGMDDDHHEDAHGKNDARDNTEQSPKDMSHVDEAKTHTSSKSTPRAPSSTTVSKSIAFWQQEIAKMEEKRRKTLSNAGKHEDPYAKYRQRVFTESDFDDSRVHGYGRDRVGDDGYSFLNERDQLLHMLQQSHRRSVREKVLSLERPRAPSLFNERHFDWSIRLKKLDDGIAEHTAIEFGRAIVLIGGVSGKRRGSRMVKPLRVSSSTATAASSSSLSMSLRSADGTERRASAGCDDTNAHKARSTSIDAESMKKAIAAEAAEAALTLPRSRSHTQVKFSGSTNNSGGSPTLATASSHRRVSSCGGSGALPAASCALQDTVGTRHLVRFVNFNNEEEEEGKIGGEGTGQGGEGATPTKVYIHMPHVTGATATPSSLRGHTCARVGSRFYIFGGFVNNVLSNEFFMLTLINDETIHWSKPRVKASAAAVTPNNSPARVPCARVGHTLVRYEGKLYIFGGFDGTQYLNDLYELDIDTLTWRRIPTTSTPLPRGWHSCTVIGNHIFVYGGTNGKRDFGELYRLTLDKGDTTADTGSPPRGTGRGKEKAQQARVEHGRWSMMAGVSMTADDDVVPLGRSRHGACRIGKHLLIFGGKRIDQPSSPSPKRRKKRRKKRRRGHTGSGDDDEATTGGGDEGGSRADERRATTTHGNSHGDDREEDTDTSPRQRQSRRQGERKDAGETAEADVVGDGRERHRNEDSVHRPERDSEDEEEEDDDEEDEEDDDDGPDERSPWPQEGRVLNDMWLFTMEDKPQRRFRPVSKAHGTSKRPHAPPPLQRTNSGGVSVAEVAQVLSASLAKQLRPVPTATTTAEAEVTESTVVDASSSSSSVFALDMSPPSKQRHTKNHNNDDDDDDDDDDEDEREERRRRCVSEEDAVADDDVVDAWDQPPSHDATTAAAIAFATEMEEAQEPMYGWKELKGRMPVGRYQHTLTRVGTRLVVIGGRRERNITIKGTAHASLLDDPGLGAFHTAAHHPSSNNNNSTNSSGGGPETSSSGLAATAPMTVRSSSSGGGGGSAVCSSSNSGSGVSSSSPPDRDTVSTMTTATTTPVSVPLPTSTSSTPSTSPSSRLMHSSSSPSSLLSTSSTVSLSTAKDNPNAMLVRTSTILGDIWSINTVTLPDGAPLVDLSEIRLEKEIGRGHFSVVYCARWNNKIVAVKRLSTISKKKKDGKELLQEFRTELSLLSELSHENLVSFVGFCEKPLAIIMEYLPMTLYTYVHGGHRMDEELVLQISKDIARGMEYIHKMNIIHRDLKSSNVLLDENLTAKIADLGIAREKSTTTTMSTIGTVAWAAPELLNHERYDEKVDVYSYGIVLWELVMQEVPYEGMNPMEAGILVVTQQLRPCLPNDIDPDWGKIIVLCWNQEPATRPSFPDILDYLKNNL